MKWIILAIFAVLFLTPAEARQHRHHHVHHGIQHTHGTQHHAMHKVRHTNRYVRHHVSRVRHAQRIRHYAFHRHYQPRTRYAEATIVAHPEGCPRSAFCGCGAAVRVFGQPIRSLWLAANWFKFPRSVPAPGTVAVRQHHVMVLEADLGGGIWRVYDANSGGHATRIHARPIAGYTIVNPHREVFARADSSRPHNMVLRTGLGDLAP